MRACRRAVVVAVARATAGRFGAVESSRHNRSAVAPGLCFALVQCGATVVDVDVDVDLDPWAERHCLLWPASLPVCNCAAMADSLSFFYYFDLKSVPLARM